MRTFNFANLVGSKPKAAEDTDDDDKKPEAETDEDEAPEAMTDEDEQPEAATEQDEDEAAKDDMEDEEASAFRRGVAKGQAKERERCAAIFAEASPATIQMAANLAFNTNVSPAEAKAILASAPKATTGRLAAAMAGRNPAPISKPSADAGCDDDLPPELKAAQAAALKQKDR